MYDQTTINAIASAVCGAADSGQRIGAADRNLVAQTIPALAALVDDVWRAMYSGGRAPSIGHRYPIARPGSEYRDYGHYFKRRAAGACAVQSGRAILIGEWNALDAQCEREGNAIGAMIGYSSPRPRNGRAPKDSPCVKQRRYARAANLRALDRLRDASSANHPADKFKPSRAGMTDLVYGLGAKQREITTTADRARRAAAAAERSLKRGAAALAMQMSPAERALLVKFGLLVT